MTFHYGGRSTLGSVMEREGTRLLKVGEIARLSGLAAGTILKYEEQRLLQPLSRSAAGHRLYGQEEVARVEFIRRAKLAGLTLAEIKELLILIAEDRQGEVDPRLKDVLEEKLRETELKMQELGAFRASLLYYRRQFEQKENEG